MPKARKHQIALEATRYDQRGSRSVRSAFRWWTDSAKGQCAEHLRTWLADRLLGLAQNFAVNVAAFPFLSN